jgi:hypothetical protein
VLHLKRSTCEKSSSMKTLTLNKKILGIIILMQDKKRLSISESILDIKCDWLKNVRSYYFDLPDHILVDTGLVKNEYCLSAILRFDITSEILSTESDDLKLFTFTY